MSSPQQQNLDAAVTNADLLVSGGIDSFVTKSEDLSTIYPSYASSQDPLASSSSHVPPVGSPFGPGPTIASLTHVTRSSHQVDMDVLPPQPHQVPSPYEYSLPQSQPVPLAPAPSTDDMQGVIVSNHNSPESQPSPVTDPSITSSPPPALFSNSASSSLASALGSSGIDTGNRSRSGSATSPSYFTSLKKRQTPPLSASEFTFSVLLGSNFVKSVEEETSAGGDDPHMLAMIAEFEKLKKMAEEAINAAKRNPEAFAKVKEKYVHMKRPMNNLGSMMAQLEINDPAEPRKIAPIGSSHRSSPPEGSRSHHAASSSTSSKHPLLSSLPSPPDFSSVVTVPDADGLVVSSPIDSPSPDSDGSRKRCASSLDVRINKAQRLEATDGSGIPPLTQPASPPRSSLSISALASPPAPASAPGPPPPPSVALSAAGVVVSPVALPPMAQSPPSAAPSRPVSPTTGVSLGSIAATPTVWGPILPPQAASAAPVAVAPPTLVPTAAYPLSLGLSTLTTTSIANPISPVTATGISDATLVPASQVGYPYDMSGALIVAPPPVPPPPLTLDMTSFTMPPPPSEVAGPSGIPFGTPAFARVPSIAPAAIVTNRPSRSSSISNPLQPLTPIATAPPQSLTTPLPNPLVYGADASVPAPAPEYVTSHSAARPRTMSRPTMPSHRSSSPEDDDDDELDAYSKHSPPLKSRNNSPARFSRHRMNGGSASGGSPPDLNGHGLSGAGHANEIPNEFRPDVDRIFFEFLARTCSNLDATDAKGEPIHQTLMAKKMQRLDESPDFRPFKFRIQAFTNAFLEELARQGYPEEKIAMKKVRNYLWSQPYIARFNEDGKKAKSKGNHIWNIDAKKKPEGGWEFRPFRRRLAGQPPAVAYVGTKWSWAPRIWDPQASRTNATVHFSSTNHPTWMSWKDGVLQGIPPPDAQDCDITIEARSIQDGQEEVLQHTVRISVSPVTSANDMPYGASRPSLAGERRGHSDSVLANVPSATGLRHLQPHLQPPPPPLPEQHQTTRDPLVKEEIAEVLQIAAAGVVEDANSGKASVPSQSFSMQDLVATHYALQQGAQATAIVGIQDEAVAPVNEVQDLAMATQEVVKEATTLATVNAMNQIPHPVFPSDVTVTASEVGETTKVAVAIAVQRVQPEAAAVDVMRQAASVLREAAQPVTVLPPAEPIRPHSTGSMQVTQTTLDSSMYATSAPLASLGSYEY